MTVEREISVPSPQPLIYLALRNDLKACYFQREERKIQHKAEAAILINEYLPSTHYVLGKTHGGPKVRPGPREEKPPTTAIL